MWSRPILERNEVSNTCITEPYFQTNNLHPWDNGWILRYSTEKELTRQVITKCFDYYQNEFVRLI